MKSLLFLCHRLPLPPNKGDKIRAYHILHALTQRFRVQVGTFVDAKEDWQYVATLRSMVAELKVRPLPKLRATLRSSIGLLSGEPLSLPYYRDAELARWVSETLQRGNVDYAYVYSSAMGQYIKKGQVGCALMDFCDLDSDKWLQFSQTRNWPMSWIYRREARKLAQVERTLASQYDRSLFVTDAETRSFCANAVELEGNAVTLRNGVDTDYFNPELSLPVVAVQQPSVVFTGAMDYWANADAVSWFVSEVWPAVLERFPTARFWIVGSRPTESVKRLAGAPGVVVTGSVPDVRPYLASATAVVVPLRIARGVQNKLLEALSMGRPIVATPAAVVGLDGQYPASLSCAASAGAFATAVVDIFQQARDERHGLVGRDFVLRNYSWAAALQPLWNLLDSGVAQSAIASRA